MIMAYWPVENSHSTLELQVGIIKQFLKHKTKVMLNDTTKHYAHTLQNRVVHLFCVQT